MKLFGSYTGPPQSGSHSSRGFLLRHPGLVLLGAARYSTPLRQRGLLRWHLCHDTFHQQERWTLAELFLRSQHTLFRGPSGLGRGSATGIAKAKVLLRRHAWLATVGNFFSVWLGLFYVAQMLGTVLGAVIFTLFSSDMKGFTHDLCSNGVWVGWSYGNALVDEFMLTCLLVFTVLQTALNSDFDCSSVASFAFGLAVFPGHSLLMPIDGAPSIRPDLTFQLSWRGSVNAGRTPSSTCEASGLGPQAVAAAAAARSLKGSVHRALSISAWRSHRTAGHTVNASSTPTPTPTPYHTTPLHSAPLHALHSTSNPPTPNPQSSLPLSLSPASSHHLSWVASLGWGSSAHSFVVGSSHQLC